MKKGRDGVMLISLYEDDLLFAGSTMGDVLKVKRKLSDRFETQNCYEAQISLGPEISLDRSKKSSTFVRQAMLESYGYDLACKTLNQPTFL